MGLEIKLGRHGGNQFKRLGRSLRWHGWQGCSSIRPNNQTQNKKIRRSLLMLIQVVTFPITWLVLKATCCSDNRHCCPSGYRCDDQSERCFRAVSNDTLPWMKKERASSIAFEAPVNMVCPDGSSCAPMAACCGTYTGSFTCCNFPNVSSFHVITFSRFQFSSYFDLRTCVEITS